MATYQYPSVTYQEWRDLAALTGADRRLYQDLLSRMDAFFADFRAAYYRRSGTDLSKTLLPSLETWNVHRLDTFYQAGVRRFYEQIIHSHITNNPNAGYRMSKPEGKAWQEVYASFWKFVGVLLGDEDRPGNSINWPRVYTAWRDVSNMLIKGYSAGCFEAWTIPCLYVVGRYLRIFAIKADEQSQKLDRPGTFTADYQDDMVEESSKHEKLEDSARVLNRIFTLCISDRQVNLSRYLDHSADGGRERAPLEDSRKWGIYYVTDLLFKTYFRVCTALDLNALRCSC